MVYGRNEFLRHYSINFTALLFWLCVDSSEISSNTEKKFQRATKSLPQLPAFCFSRLATLKLKVVLADYVWYAVTWQHSCWWRKFLLLRLEENAADHWLVEEYIGGCLEFCWERPEEGDHQLISTGKTVELVGCIGSNRTILEEFLQSW